MGVIVGMERQVFVVMMVIMNVVMVLNLDACHCSQPMNGQQSHQLDDG